MNNQHDPVFQDCSLITAIYFCFVIWSWCPRINYDTNVKKGFEFYSHVQNLGTQGHSKRFWSPPLRGFQLLKPQRSSKLYPSFNFWTKIQPFFWLKIWNKESTKSSPKSSSHWKEAFTPSRVTSVTVCPPLGLKGYKIEFQTLPPHHFFPSN